MIAVPAIRSCTYAVVSDQVLQALWESLLPAGEARVTPEFARAQAATISDGFEPVGNGNGVLSSSSISPQRLKQIVDNWEAFEQNKLSWKTNPYNMPHFLDGYFVYLGSRYALAIQFALMDLLRWGYLPSCLHVLDVGVGPATATLGVFEFLRKLALACRAAKAQFPIVDFRACSLDRSAKVLEYAEHALHHYAQSLPVTPNDPDLSQIQQWACASRPCIQHDLGNPLQRDLEWQPNLLLFSSVVSDVLFCQKSADTSFSELVHCLQPCGAVIIIEHPVYKGNLQQWLNNWSALSLVQTPDCLLRRRSQTFRPHDLFDSMVRQTPSLAVRGHWFAEPVNSQLVWDQAIFVKS